MISNVRELKKRHRQREVKNLLAQNKTRFGALAETKVKIAYVNRMLNRIASQWLPISNGVVSNRSRTWMMWDPGVLNAHVL